MLNKQIEKTIDRICDEEEKQFEQDTDHLIAITEPKMDKSSHAAIKLEATKNLIYSYTEIRKFKAKAKVGYLKIIKLMRNEIFRINKEELDSFWFRNFSSKVSIEFLS